MDYDGVFGPVGLLTDDVDELQDALDGVHCGDAVIRPRGVVQMEDVLSLVGLQRQRRLISLVWSSNICLFFFVPMSLIFHSKCSEIWICSWINLNKTWIGFVSYCSTTLHFTVSTVYFYLWAQALFLLNKAVSELCRCLFPLSSGWRQGPHVGPRARGW